MYFLLSNPWLPIIIFLVILLLPSMIVITSQQNVRLIETFGKFSSVRQAGLSFKLPWPIQSATSNFSMRVREIGEDVGVKSSDNAFVVVPIRVQFAVKEGGAQDAFYRLDDPETQIRSYVVNQVRATASSMTFDDLFKSRDAFETDVEQTLAARMGEFGFKIENVLVDDPQPSTELREAFDRVIAAQRLKDAATNEGEALRIKSVAAANAEGESLRIKGEAYAKFRNIIAEGNAEALKKFTATTGLTDKDALDFFTSVNEMEAVTTAAEAGGNIVFVAGNTKSGVEHALLGAMAQIKQNEG
ncbi:SPFH domain-containing protein [Paracoccus saliphilus]|uniref:Regulator of protease activity HflC, stomatin/prohibitin superfamily n=1 Tax=Paracoccus saliphilus TaxID=405559 RepID=A0AA45W2R2_9RHOB|nr:SPFH domain-containing protein [Paracoccus saliphilus]WCR01392.1 hypothetical protein JHX88_10545 [Paracoccus saliphilus]SIS70092.1 Regulator of protease activity HflC, stomatin/prohibitin superfamily [Paracoccus saliphilus]